MTYYIDTSALVKIYHREAGTDNALALYKSDELIWISELCRIEFTSTIERKYREKTITIETLHTLIEKFQDDLKNRYNVLKFSSVVIDEAETLLQRFGEKKSLRTLDSLQFAFFTTYCEQDTQFVCCDTTLIQLVKEEGFSVINPELEKMG